MMFRLEKVRGSPPVVSNVTSSSVSIPTRKPGSTLIRRNAQSNAERT